MTTTQDYIDQLKIDKQNLVSILNNMGVEANNSETFTSLTPKVGKIVTDPILQDKSVEITENGTTTITADSGYDGLNNVEVTTNVASGGMYAPRKISFSAYMGTELNAETSNLDTSNLTSMANMFSQCFYLTSVDTSNFITNNVTNMYRMFYDCGKLTTPNLTSFDTSNVTLMHEMFYNCTTMKDTLDLSSFNTSKVTNMNSMLYRCGATTIIFGENFDTRNVTDMGSMMFHCGSLANLVIKSPNFVLNANIFTGTSTTVNIYVPDAYVDTYKTRAYWSSKANYIKPLSEWQG